MESKPIEPVQLVPASGDQKGFAIAGFVISILALGAWLQPMLGLPLAGASLILSIMGVNSSKRVLAIIGIVLSSIALVAAIVYGVSYAVLHAGEAFQHILQTGGY